MPTNTETVTIAIIGMNRIGKVHYQNLRGMPNVRVKYICDVVLFYI